MIFGMGRKSRPEPVPAPEMISASDLASWEFCRESWRLARLEGRNPTNTAQRKAGERHHARWHMLYTLTRAMIWTGVLLAAVAAALLLAGGWP